MRTWGREYSGSSLQENSRDSLRHSDISGGNNAENIGVPSIREEVPSNTGKPCDLLRQTSGRWWREEMAVSSLKSRETAEAEVGFELNLDRRTDSSMSRSNGSVLDPGQQARRDSESMARPLS